MFNNFIDITSTLYTEIYHFMFSLAISKVEPLVKNLPAMRETWIRSLGWEDLLEEGMATHSSILAWRIPQRSLVGYSPWSRKE